MNFVSFKTLKRMVCLPSELGRACDFLKIFLTLLGHPLEKTGPPSFWWETCFKLLWRILVDTKFGIFYTIHKNKGIWLQCTVLLFQLCILVCSIALPCKLLDGQGSAVNPESFLSEIRSWNDLPYSITTFQTNWFSPKKHPKISFR